MKYRKDVLTVQVIIIVTFIIIFPAIAQGITMWQLSLSSTSSIKTSSPILAITGASKASSSAVTSISWGSLYPGQSTTFSTWIYNDHPQMSYILSIAASKWTPAEAANYLTLTWDHDGYKLAPLTSTLVVLTLTVSSDIKEITTFGFEVNINAAEA